MDDSCDPVTGCVNEWLCTTPSDVCTQRGCDISGACIEETKNCDDGNPCTTDSCDVSKGGCVHIDTCDDGNACTIDFCNSATGECYWEYACPDDHDPCTTDFCTPSSNAAGYTCDYVVCPGGGVCCEGLTTCCPAENCCGNDQCCGDSCEGCIPGQNGFLYGGTVTVSADPVCIGDTITFTASGVVDSGGIKRVQCTAKTEIPPVTPSYTWIITMPDGSTISGGGSVAGVVTLIPGTYSCTFTAKASRECPPDDYNLPVETGYAYKPELTTPASYLPENQNTVSYTLTLPPEVGPDQLRFELFDVSDFPGDAMNHGNQSDSDSDYKFEISGNSGYTISSNQLTATTIAAVSTATVTVTAYDFGARGKIKVKLMNLGCESDPVDIPLDTDGDWLPDAYENGQSNMDANNNDTDGDGTPDGEEDDDPDRTVVANSGPNYQGARTTLGLTGDGLTAFEEYRGFYLLGVHTRTSTVIKDVFAGIDANSGGAISVLLGFFPNLVGFNVHEISVTNQPFEWKNTITRFINWQKSGIPGVSDQRALRIIVNNNINDLGLTTPMGAVANQSPNETIKIEINLAAHVVGMNGKVAGADGILCTADDQLYTLTAAEALDVLRETVGHECGHGCHLEHNFCDGDRHLIPENQGVSNTINVTSGIDGVCDTIVVNDDVQLVPIGQGLPNAIIIVDGGDGVMTTPAGDDTIQGNTITSGADGIAQTVATNDDIQVIPVGQGLPNTDCINTGSDGISNSAVAVDDTQRIPVGQGEPNQTGIDDGGDGVLTTVPFGDDQVVGLTITTGVNGILQTVADIFNQGVISNMTSNVLVPVPNTYSTDDLDQVRFHLKHP